MCKSRKRTSSKKRRAYHEAGHAVIGHLFESGLKRISILHNPRKHRFGYTLRKNADLKRLEGLNPSEIQEEVRYILGSRTVLSFAGFLAEHIYDGEPKELKIGPGARTDLQIFVNLMKAWKFTEPQEDRLMKTLLKLTTKFLKDNWGAVNALAIALIEKGTINGREATKIIEREINTRNSEAVSKSRVAQGNR